MHTVVIGSCWRALVTARLGTTVAHPLFTVGEQKSAA